MSIDLVRLSAEQAYLLHLRDGYCLDARRAVDKVDDPAGSGLLCGVSGRLARTAWLAFAARHTLAADRADYLDGRLRAVCRACRAGVSYLSPLEPHRCLAKHRGADQGAGRCRRR